MEKMGLDILINQDVDWESEDSYYFFNPKQKQKENDVKYLPLDKNRIYITTSGGGKIAGLSKKAFLISAKSVNQHLACHKKDRWLDVLPFFHVASLAVKARSFCGEFSYLKTECTWNPTAFQEELGHKKITLTSLVPAQVYDLIQLDLSSPPDLRALLVGGGALDPALYQKARKLGWPLLPTYGLTEMASQVATAPLHSLKENKFPSLEILSHVNARDRSGFIEIRSSSLLDGYLYLSQKKWESIKSADAWFRTEDKGQVQSNFLIITGRSDEQVKILGESVDLNSLSKVLNSIFKEAYLLATPCERNGFQIDLITSSFDCPNVLKAKEQFNQKVLPYERIKNIYLVKNLQRGSLFKIRQDVLRKQIGFKEE